MNDIPDILQKILRHKTEEVAQRAQQTPLQQIQAEAEQASPPRGFLTAIQTALETDRPAVIAEIKKASPSKGVLRPDFDPAAIANSYESAGATCLSVLTDHEFFQGSTDYLIAAREACHLPVLRKDFMIDAWQVYEARAMGADCILLIVAALADDKLRELADLAGQLQMDVLIEVHDREEMERALMLRLPLIGINNRDLRSFETRLDTTLGLLTDIPPDRIVVTESGILSSADVALMQDNDVNAFLIGEAFMRAEDPGAALTSLFG